MTVTIAKNSRLRFSRLVTVDGYEFWNFFEYPTIEAQQDDIRHQVQGTDRMDLLAYRYYKSPRLWWVIAVANGMDILPTELVEGAIITIPSPRYVSQFLFEGAPV
jgi:hypothetical protein